MKLRAATIATLMLTIAGYPACSNAAEPKQDALPTQEVIRFESLLEEMIDRDATARLSNVKYEQRQASSYNRLSTARDQAEQDTNGWFADSDGVSAIRSETSNGRSESVLMEHDGPGCITKIWATYFYYDFNDHKGPTVRIYLDGNPTPVIEQGLIELVTRNEWPAHYGAAPSKASQLDIPVPLACFTARAGNLYLPIPFAKSCKVTLEGKPFYNIINYRAYEPGTVVETFSTDVLRANNDKLRQVAKELLQPTSPHPSQRIDARLTLSSQQSSTLTMSEGPAAIRLLTFKLDPQQITQNPGLLRSTVVQLRFDGERTAWIPLGDFFASPNTLNPFQTWSRSASTDGTLQCWWVMPYRKSAELTITNLGPQLVSLDVAASIGEWRWDDRSLLWNACWRADDVVAGDQFQDWNFVDIRGQGKFLGDQWTVLNLYGDWWGEGDEKIYVDDSYDGRKFPDHFGTGTEDYYGWAGGEVPKKRDQFNHPFLANVLVGSTTQDTPYGFNICTRERGLDAIPFSSRLRFDIEASPGVTQRAPHDLLAYSSVAFFYARPGAKTNRDPLPAAAAKPIIALEELRLQSESIRQKGANTPK